MNKRNIEELRRILDTCVCGHWSTNHNSDFDAPEYPVPRLDCRLCGCGQFDKDDNGG